ncbi:MAG: SDR family NAD(P)-dependent oxidoreductase [Actinobacteria bacterium]|nr:SDR family NAD(P)-dependent oxidoreductase [Actinomycetota bacterium]
MSRLCEGRVVIVTGSGRGIGREHALSLAKHGAFVVVNDLGAGVDGKGGDASPAQQVVNEIEAMGGKAIANGDDISSWDGAERLIKTAVETFGDLHAVVNNAGILRDRMLANMSEEEWDAVIKVHLKGTFAPSRHAAAYWRDQSKAGKAGVAAALTLVASGKDVLIIDKAVFPRDKCCGDGLTTGALRILEMLGFNPNSVANYQICDEVALRSPSGREIQLDLPNARDQKTGQFAAIAPRIELDNALVQHARASGVRIVENCAFVSVASQNSHEIIVNTDCPANLVDYKEITAKFMIAADGMWSPVRKSLGASQSGYLGEWHAFRQYVGNVTGPASKKLFVWFEKDLLPGYAWSFPLPNGRANIGFGILRGSKYSVQEMKALWVELLSRPHIASALGQDATLEGRHTAWPIPARITSAKLSSGRTLFVGDAVCAADTMTGEGIGQALLTGVLAAESITSSPQYNQHKICKSYSQKIKREFFADHRMSYVLGKILQNAVMTRGVLRLAGYSNWTRRNFVRWMFEDEPRAAVLTPSRWHRKFLKRDGAFKLSQSLETK